MKKRPAGVAGGSPCSVTQLQRGSGTPFHQHRLGRAEVCVMVKRSKRLFLLDFSKFNLFLAVPGIEPRGILPPSYTPSPILF